MSYHVTMAAKTASIVGDAKVSPEMAAVRRPPPWRFQAGDANSWHHTLGHMDNGNTYCMLIYTYILHISHCIS